jgi:LysR family nitrogen assimilation transcriptional regulator
MDLKRLRTFVAVAEHGTISKAAAVLNTTQPALSRQIGSLEQDFGFALFERSGRRLLITPRGEQLLADCRSLLTRAASLAERAQALRRGEIKVLKVAGSALTIEAIFPTFLHFHAERVPGVRVTLIEAETGEHLNMLERGDVHFAINVINHMQVDDNRFAHYALPSFQLVAAAARSLKMDEADAADIRQVCELPLLLLNRSYATRSVFDAACQVAGVRQNIFAESAAPRVLLQLAEAGHGVAIIPSILQRDLGKLRVRRVTYRGDPLLLKLAVLWDRQRTLPGYAQEFSSLLAEHLGDMFPPARRSADKLSLVR